MALDLACGVKSHPLAERGRDLYETPPCATHALLDVERLPLCIYDPAAGRNSITTVLRNRGHEVVCSDIYDYGGLDFVADFLTQDRAPPGCEAVVTNPPYQIAATFVAHALKLTPVVVMLMRLAFLESERRRHVLEDCGLARIHVFRKRLPMMHRDGWAGPRASSAIPFAWFIWERGHRGPITIDRISWER